MCSVVPIGFVLRVFQYLYANNVVQQEAILKWKDDETLNSKFPGKVRFGV